MLKEDLLIALSKSNQGQTELLEHENNIKIRETKKFFNKLKNNFSQDEIKEVEEKINRKEHVYSY